MSILTDPAAITRQDDGAGRKKNKKCFKQEQKRIDGGITSAVSSLSTTVAPAADQAAQTRIAELLHQRRSDRGRLLMLQRRLREYEKAAAALPAAAPKTHGRPDTGTDATNPHPFAADDPLTARVASCPDVGRPVATLIDDLRRENAALTSRLAALTRRAPPGSG